MSDLHLWEAELSPEREEELLRALAEKIRKRRMEMPVTLALEMHKPLAGITGAAGLTFAPFLVPFLGFDGVNDYTRLFSKRENYERLMDMLERRPDAAEVTCPPAS